MKVVIADDSALIRDRLREMFSQFEQVELVGLCKNGAETFAVLKSENPDLAIVDIKMPELNGLEVLREIRHQNKTMQFIILTFHATEYYRQMAFDAGANYFFSKTDDFDKIETTVNEILKHLEKEPRIRS